MPHSSVLSFRFNLPPAAALTSVLFALPAAPVLWGAAMLVSLVAGIAIVWPRVDWWHAVLLGIVLIAWVPVQSAVTWANTNSLVLLLLAIALRFRRHAGWAVGMAIALKAAPILLLAWLIGERRWREVVTALGVATLLTVVVALVEGPQVVTDFLQVRLNEVPNAGRTSWGIVPLGVPAFVAYGTGGVLAAAAVWRASFTLAVLAVLAAIPSPHAHYWILLLVPLLGILPQRLGGDLRGLVAVAAGPSARPMAPSRPMAQGAVVLAGLVLTALSVHSLAPAVNSLGAARDAGQGRGGISFSGSGVASSDGVELSGGQYRLDWEAAPDGTGCHHSAWLRSRNDPAVLRLVAAQLVIRSSAEGSVAAIGIAPGSYYLEAGSPGCSWALTLAPLSLD